jgi:hypothetical protein
VNNVREFAGKMTAWFDIIPAVPSEDVAESLSVNNKEEENPAPVPRQFSPVPAVPDDSQDIDRQPKKVLQLNVGDYLENNVMNPKKVRLPRNCIENVFISFVS